MDESGGTSGRRDAEVGSGEEELKKSLQTRRGGIKEMWVLRQRQMREIHGSRMKRMRRNKGRK